MPLIYFLSALQNCLLHFVLHKTDRDNNRLLYKFENYTPHHPLFEIFGHEGNIPKIISNTDFSRFSKTKVFFMNLSRYSEFCTAKLIIPDFQDKYFSNNLLKHLESSENLFENPRIVLLFQDISINSNTKNIEIEDLTHKLKLIQTDSTYFFVKPYKSKLEGKHIDIEAHRVCLSCKIKLEKVNHQNHLIMNPSSDEKNLQGMQINCPGITYIYHFLPPPIECNRLGLYFRGEERYCAIKTISKSLNFSTIDGNIFQPGLQIASNQISILMANERQGIQQYVWLPNGQIIEPFSFVVVLKQSCYQIDHIIETFDVSTWTLLLLSIVTLSVTISLISTQVNGLYDYSSIVVLIGTILEQSPSTFINKMYVNGHILRSLLTVWLLIGVVISGAYKGTFYSFLTKKDIPHIPRNFRELVESNVKMISADSIFSREFYNYSRLLENLVIEYEYYAVNSPKFQENYKLFRNMILKTTFLQGITYSKVRAIHELGLQVPKMFMHLHTDKFRFSDSWAFVSSTSGVDHFIKIMHSNNDESRLILKSPHKENLLSLRTMFIVSKSFFSFEFMKKFNNLFESGIYRIWEKYRKVVYSKWDKSLYECYMKLPVTIFNFTGCWMDSKTASLQTVKDVSVEQFDNTLLTFSDIQGILIIFFSGLVLAFGTAIIERITLWVDFQSYYARFKIALYVLFAPKNNFVIIW